MEIQKPIILRDNPGRKSIMNTYSNNKWASCGIKDF